MLCNNNIIYWWFQGGNNNNQNHQVSLLVLLSSQPRQHRDVLESKKRREGYILKAIPLLISNRLKSTITGG